MAAPRTRSGIETPCRQPGLMQKTKSRFCGCLARPLVIDRVRRLSARGALELRPDRAAAGHTGATAMGMMQEFQEFALKGNVVDLAVGVIIGAAFGKIVDSLVNNLLMPPVGYLIGGVNFKDLAVSLTAPGSKVPVEIKYGAFVQTVIDFAIIAFVLFMIIKAMNMAKQRFAKEAAAPAAPAAPPASGLYLKEIRDALVKR
jgi:large conductance mechanosensitive channel